MNKKTKFFLWQLNQLISVFKAFLRLTPKALVISHLNDLIDQQAKIIVRYDRKISFYLRDFYDLLGFYEIFNKNSYKKLFSDYRGEDISLIDIGAYNGDSSLYASRFSFVKKIISIEPHPNNFNILKKNIALNNAKNVLPLNAAVSNFKKVEMFIYKNRRQTGIFSNGISRRKFIVKGIDLKSLIRRAEGKVFIKCDTEGSEFDIFLNEPIGSMLRVTRIMIEYHSLARLPDLISSLKKAGFKVRISKNRFISGFGYIYAFRY